MRVWQTALLAGVAVAALGFAGAAAPASAQQAHIMTVQLPGGGVAQIEYAGNVAPRVSIGNTPMPFNGLAPLPAFFGPDSPFAQFDRISAAMDREAAAMFREAATMAAEARAEGLSEAAMQSLPPGSRSYSFTTAISGDHVCSESVEITRPGNGGAPQVTRHSSGNCGALLGFGGTPGSVDLPNAAPAPPPRPTWTRAPAVVPAVQPHAVWTSAAGAEPYAGLVEPIPTATR